MVEPSVKSSEHGGGGVDLPPGFRFHPTDEEVITSYLLQKFLNPSFAPHAIGEVDLNKCEPWDLPSKAKMGEEDSKEWYFFCRKGMKYPTGTRANRATKEGYWKATGKDREIFFKPPPAGPGGHDDVGRREQLVGMKKTLVFYTGRAPRGTKTNWVMHEFRLIDGKYSRHHTTNDDLLLRFNPKDEWVVCKVHHKGGKHDASAAKKAAAGGGGGEEQQYSSAAGTPNVSSVEAGGGGGDEEFLVDSMLLDYYSSSSHLNSSGPTPPISVVSATATAAVAAPPPHNADYCCSCYPVHTTACTTSSSSRSRSSSYYYYSLHHQQEMVAAKALAASSPSSAAGLPSASVAAGAGAAQRSSQQDGVQQQQRLLPAGNYNYCDDGGNYYAAGYRTSQYY